jgi:hypothetical protein
MARLSMGCPKWDVNFLLIGNEQGYAAVREVDEHALCMCMAQELRTLLSRNDARTDASDVRMTGFRSLTTRPRNPPVLATNIASEILTGKAFKRAADEFQHAVPAPVASNMYGDVTSNIFPAQHPLRADPHAMIYTDGSVIQSNSKELETTGSKRIRLETTTAIIAGAGRIYIPRALVTDDLMSRLNDEASNTAFQSCGDEHTDGVAISLEPGGEGATNTITRAEGAAIWCALREGLGTTIATDSAAVLYQIRNMRHRPATMQHCKNKALIQQIVDVTSYVPAHTTSTCKK